MTTQDKLEKVWFGIHKVMGELEELRDTVEVIQQDFMMEEIEKEYRKSIGEV